MTLEIDFSNLYLNFDANIVTFKQLEPNTTYTIDTSNTTQNLFIKFNFSDYQDGQEGILKIGTIYL